MPDLFPPHFQQDLAFSLEPVVDIVSVGAPALDEQLVRATGNFLMWNYLRDHFSGGALDGATDRRRMASRPNHGDTSLRRRGAALCSNDEPIGNRKWLSGIFSVWLGARIRSIVISRSRSTGYNCQLPPAGADGLQA